MKKTLLFLLVYKLCTVALSQDYSIYHQKIKAAEEALTQEDFALSVNIYDTVFKTYAFKFAKDVAHATQIALVAGNYKQAESWIDSCMASGISLSCLKDIALIQSYMSHALDSTVLKNKEKYYDSVYAAKINKDLLAEWSRRFHCEQFAKHKSTDDFITCLRDNYEAIKNALLETGIFPGEKIMGISTGFYDTLNDIPSDKVLKYIERLPDGDSVVHEVMITSKIRKKDCNLNNEFVIPTLLHTGVSFAQLKPQLDKALVNGSLHPRDYMYIQQFEKYNGSGQMGYKKYYQYTTRVDKKNVHSLCFNMGWGKGCDDNNFANSCRKKIGICSVEVDKKKKDIADTYGVEFFDIVN